MGRSGLGIEIGWVTVSALIFADDIVLCGGSEIELSQLLEFIWQELDELGLNINGEKSMVLPVGERGKARKRWGRGVVKVSNMIWQVGLNKWW